MNNNIKKEIVSAIIDGKPFEEFKYDIDNSLYIFYDDKNLYCTIEYENKPLISEPFYDELSDIFSTQVCLCLFNLYDEILKKFTQFHLKHTPTEKHLLYHAVILSSKKDFNIIKKTIDLINSQDKNNNYEESIKYYNFQDNHLIVMDIAVFYHILNSGILLHRNKIVID